MLNLINTANETKFRAETDMNNVLKILEELVKDLAGKQVEITFSQDDSHPSVIEAGGKVLTGSLELGDGGLTDLVGVPIQEDLMMLMQTVKVCRFTNNYGALDHYIHLRRLEPSRNN